MIEERTIFILVGKISLPVFLFDVLHALPTEEYPGILVFSCYRTLQDAVAVYVGCICDPVISVRVLRLSHKNSVNYSWYIYC